MGWVRLSLIIYLATAIGCSASFNKSVHAKDYLLTSGAGGFFSIYLANPNTGLIQFYKSFSSESVSTADVFGLGLYPGGKFLYAAYGSGSSNIAQFNFDFAAGALRAITPPAVAAGTDLGTIVIDSADSLIFVSSPTDHKIYTYAVDSGDTGTLTLVSNYFHAGIVNIALHPTQKLFLDTSLAGAVAAYTFDPKTYTMALLSKVAATCGSIAAVAASPTGEFALNTCAPSSWLGLSSIDNTGVTLINKATASTLSNNSSVLFHPTLPYIYSADGVSGINQFRYSSGGITLVNSFALGQAVQVVALGSNSGFLYASGSTSLAKIFVLAIDPDTGALSLVQTVDDFSHTIKTMQYVHSVF